MRKSDSLDARIGATIRLAINVAKRVQGERHDMSGAEAIQGAKGGSGRIRSLAEVARGFSSGERIFLPGSTGESAEFTRALCEAAQPLDITASFVPGINPVPLAALPEGTIVSSLFSPPADRNAKPRATFRHLPFSYGGFAAHLRDHLTFDACVVHVAPPDDAGRCSLGTAVEFTPLAVSKSKRVIAIINPRVPRLPNAAFFPFACFDEVVECDAPLREYVVGPPTEQASAIAGHVADFIGDGAALQIGLGKVPDALMARLTDRRGLRLHSGMLSDGVKALVEAGALDLNFATVSCVHVGSRAHYEWLAGRADFSVRGCDYTHDPGVLASLSGFVAVNSALSVDLFGQANLEMLDGRAISGVGGASDFARGAALAPGGLSIIALPATSGKSDLPRIIPSLSGLCSLPRTDIHVVVTEHGAADLRGLSMIERAERLIEVAAPQHRGALRETWREMAKRL